MRTSVSNLQMYAIRPETYAGIKLGMSVDWQDAEGGREEIECRRSPGSDSSPGNYQPPQTILRKYGLRKKITMENGLPNATPETVPGQNGRKVVQTRAFQRKGRRASDIYSLVRHASSRAAPQGLTPFREGARHLYCRSDSRRDANPCR